MERCQSRCPHVTRGSLDTSTILVLFSFICIFVIIGLSIWVTKLTKRLKQYEEQHSRIHTINNSSNNVPSFVYEISNQSTSKQQQTKPYTTLKVLERNNVPCPNTSSQNTPVNSSCGHVVPHIVLAS